MTEPDDTPRDEQFDDQLHVPSFDGDAPVNYRDLRESLALAVYAEGVDADTIQDAIRTVDDAVVQNEDQLLWESELSQQGDET